jgi:hypothetical protein
MLVSGNNVYVAWKDAGNDSGFESDIFFRVSTNNGQTFNSPIPVSVAGDTGVFKMLIAGNNVYVVFTDIAPDLDDVFFRVSTNNGQTFNPIISLSNNAGISSNPQMLVSGNNVYVAWVDNTNGGDNDIFFRASTNNGQTFNPFIDLSNNAGISGNPQMFVSGNNVYVAWEDDTNGPDNDIFFRASTNNGQTFNSVRDLSNNTGSSTSPEIVA